ncbi:aminotransferase class V-fold PLP-dependent enzyme [Porphyromonadaceae bacterium W3.11]|nr:aminotransferase class V-fold PLP-dependent enzyme [Porphyromonadaceae bacterium W3.11]
MLTEPDTIYLDNASTSYPKPNAVHEVLAHYYDKPIGSYGRNGDLNTIRTAGVIEDLRDLLASKIGADGLGSHMIFTHNSTDGINRVLNGLPPLQPHEVVISPMEHNSVTRPLYAKLRGQSPLILPHLTDGGINIEMLYEFLEECKKSTSIKLVILNEMSNVNGVTQPIAEVIKTFREAFPESQILIDASQSFPYTQPLLTQLLPDFLVMTGHKGSLGPTGTGALFILHPESLTPSVQGGNGYRSEEQAISPYMPDRFEAGTLNMLGLTAWYAALTSLESIHIEREVWLEHLIKVKSIPGIKVYSSNDSETQGPLYSIRSEKFTPSQLGDQLMHRYHISTRSGLHCAPLAHRSLGTLPEGTTRISISALTPNSYLETLYQSLYELHQ